MSWAAHTDRVISQCVKTFATSVIYIPKVGPQKTINAVFDKDYAEVEILDGPPVQSTGPRIGIRVADLDAQPTRGDKCTISGVTYRVDEYRPDGQGGATLILDKA